MTTRDKQFGWKDGVSLKEHFEARLNAMDKATETAYQSMQLRLETMNEFRAQLTEQKATFVTRSELDLIMERINKDSRANTATLIAVLSLLLGIAGFVLK